MRRSPLSFAALAVAASAALAACAPPEEEAEAPAEAAVPVEVLVADPGLFEDAIELTGTAESPNDALLSPDAPGTLTYVAPVGTAVRRGGVVARVRASAQQAGVSQARAGAAQAQAGIAQAEAAVAQAEAGVRAARAQREAAQSQLDLAQDQYSRQLPLVRDSILSPLEFRGVESQLANARAQAAQADAGIAQAEGQLRAAREGVQAARAQAGAASAGVESAQAQLANTVIRAPFSGVVEQRVMEPGELASPGQPVVRLVGAGGVKIAAGVPERYASEIEVGSPVRVIPAAYDAEPRGGRVTFVGLAVDPQSRTFPVEIAVANDDRTLKPEMVVRLELTRSVLRDAITVPTEAVVRDERGESVFVVEEDSAGVPRAARRPVELGPTSGTEVVLTAGVRPGERIIVSGQSGLAEGDRVRITERVNTASRTAIRPAGDDRQPTVRPASDALSEE
jgi:RND family efflux transporter MFP subunit